MGERLRPITDHIPKPLIPLLGKPVLEYVLEKVAALRDTAIGVNLHYRKELIEQWIKKSAFADKVALFPEDPILGTGGALKNAGAFLKDHPFVVHNSDILSDIDIKTFIDYHLSSGNIATLAVHSCPEFDNLVLDEDGHLMQVGAFCSLCREPGTRLCAFTGIAAYNPEFLKFLPDGPSSVVHAWIQAVSSGHTIGTYDATGRSWSDIGTPVSYAKTVIGILRSQGETVFFHPSSEGCSSIEMNGYIVVEKNNILPECMSLRNCIVLPEATPSSPPFTTGGVGELSFENSVLGPGFIINLHEPETLGADEADGKILIGVGGSDRHYFRMRKDGESIIFMQCGQDDPDFVRHLEYTRFFRKSAVPVPDLLEADVRSRTAVFEDLGDISLYSWLKCPRKETEIEAIYRRVLDMLVSIHAGATERVAECPLLASRIFDYAYFRWETDYFAEHFLHALCEIPLETVAALRNEFECLAATADSLHKTIIHRDFQSQNIMVTAGTITRLLDFQGARMGPPAYDVVSILWDPYYRLDDALRDRLLEYYVSQIPFTKGVLRDLSADDFRQSLLPCRLQRHMQALGAYAFLSAKKGKGYFLKHIPEGLRLLKEDVTLAANIFPDLNKVVTGLKEIVL